MIVTSHYVVHATSNMFKNQGKFNVLELNTPANEVAGVYSDPYVRPFLRPSQSLIGYSSKTAGQNFMKLSGIVHYMMSYCTSYFKFLFE